MIHFNKTQHTSETTNTFMEGLLQIHLFNK